MIIDVFERVSAFWEALDFFGFLDSRLSIATDFTDGVTHDLYLTESIVLASKTLETLDLCEGASWLEILDPSEL